VSGIQAVRAAARIREQLHTDVKMVHGSYGQFQILIDDAVVIDGGALAMLGVLPSLKRIVATVRDALAKPAAS